MTLDEAKKKVQELRKKHPNIEFGYIPSKSQTYLSIVDTDTQQIIFSELIDREDTNTYDQNKT